MANAHKHNIPALWNAAIDLYNHLSAACAISFWAGGLLLNFLWFATCIALLPNPIAAACLVLQLSLLLLPLNTPCPRWADAIIRYSYTCAIRYYGLRVLFENRDAFTKETPYIFAFEPHRCGPVWESVCERWLTDVGLGNHTYPCAHPEGNIPRHTSVRPHSVLPLTTFVFSKQAGCMPPTLHNVRMLASTAVFFASILRHFWWWTGVRPVSKSAMQHLLRTTRASCVLCPGGVRECYYMQPLHVERLPASEAALHKPPPVRLHGTEVAYLKGRGGFVRVAMEEGVDLVRAQPFDHVLAADCICEEAVGMRWEMHPSISLYHNKQVPCFSFGQTALFGFWRPFIDPPRVLPPSWWLTLARRIGFLPMMIWGQWGTPMPRRVPLTVVVGALIRVTKTADPTPEQVQALLVRFIEALQALFDKHKVEAGYAANASLKVL